MGVGVCQFDFLGLSQLLLIQCDCSAFFNQAERDESSIVVVKANEPSVVAALSPGKGVA